jgi:Holliday junction resolvase RusA-like endonuclease
VHSQVSQAIRAAFPWRGPVALSLYVTFPDRRRCDVSNRIKCLEDALKIAGVYADDSQVIELHAHKKYEKGVSRVYVMMDPLEATP